MNATPKVYSFVKTGERGVYIVSAEYQSCVKVHIVTPHSRNQCIQQKAMLSDFPYNRHRGSQ